MTRERAKELLPIIQAFADGKEIQVANYSPPHEWMHCTETDWRNECKYRIKPIPKEYWMEIGPCGTPIATHTTKPLDSHYRCIKVREVLE